MKKNDSLEVLDKYRSNPFIEETIIHIKSRSVYRGSINNKFTVYDEDTKNHGKVLQANIYEPIKVDTQQYVKLYVNNIGKVFDLTKTTEKVFEYILTRLQKDSDYFYFDHNDFMNYSKYKSKQSVYAGLKELIKHRIIAKCMSINKFWINPTIVFLGDRLVLMSDYQRIINEENE